MAIGLGTMFGFKFPENFNYPYSAVSIRDFWRRWHITLSGWFKDYLYIPLGGNRKGKLRTGFNRLFVFFCTGLWHGANWTFVVWGLYHGFFSVLENHVHIKKENKIIRFAGHIYTLLVVCIGFVIFRADTIGQAFDMIKAMFTGFDMSKDMTANVLIVLSIQFIVMAVIGIIASWPVIPGIKKLVAEHKKASNVLEALTYILALILLMLCMISLAGNGYNPFIYFRF
jgi:alginate O-acetyltransferase complex protein AlgI